MKFGMEVRLAPSNFVLDGGPHCPPMEGATGPPNLAHVHCGQTAGWIEMKFGMEVTSNFVSEGGGGIAPPHERGLRPPQIWPMSTVAKRLDGSI